MEKRNKRVCHIQLFSSISNMHNPFLIQLSQLIFSQEYQHLLMKGWKDNQIRTSLLPSKYIGRDQVQSSAPVPQLVPTKVGRAPVTAASLAVGVFGPPMSKFVFARLARMVCSEDTRVYTGSGRNIPTSSSLLLVLLAVGLP